MEHQAASERLSAFYDGELADAERQAVARHVDQCTACRQTVDAWQRTARTLFPVPEPQPTEVFVQRVMAAIEPRPATPWVIRLPDLSRWLVPALGVGLAMAALVMLQPSRSEAFSTEALLLADGGPGGGPSASTEDVLELALEES